MRARLKIHHEDWGRVELALKNVAEELPANAARTLRRASKRIVKRAQIYVPEDTTALRESIRAVEKRGGVVGGRSGRLSIDIVAGGEGVVTTPDGRMIDLDQYAIIIHERYGEFKPGEATLRKMEVYGPVVGEKFIERAMEDDRRLLEFEVAEAITKTIRASGLSQPGRGKRATSARKR